jgi:hypothetical protein
MVLQLMVINMLTPLSFISIIHPLVKEQLDPENHQFWVVSLIFQPLARVVMFIYQRVTLVIYHNYMMIIVIMVNHLLLYIMVN